MNYATIRGSERMGESDEVSYTAEDTEPYVHIDYPDNEDGREQEYQCQHCYRTVTREDDGEPWESRTHGAECPDNEDGPHEVDTGDQAHPSRWLNSAGISLTGDEVRLDVSVGDPRGCFRMTVRMMADGALMMYVPHPNDSTPHMALTEIRPGAYRIG